MLLSQSLMSSADIVELITALSLKNLRGENFRWTGFIGQKT
jgi:hypothetical protein